MELSKKERMKLKTTITRKKKAKKGQSVANPKVENVQQQHEVSAQAFPRQHRESSPIPEQFNL